MPEQVQRFTPKMGTDDQGEVWGQVKADPNGAWVRLSDYEKLEADRERVRHQRKVVAGQRDEVEAQRDA
jgi:hypothetical protein